MTAMVELKIISYNVHSCVGSDGIFSVERIASILSRENNLSPTHIHPSASTLPAADIICLQEIECNIVKQRTRLWSTMHSIDQPQIITNALGYEHVSFAPAIASIASSWRKEVHDIPRRTSGGTFGIATISKYPILDHREHRYSRYKQKTHRNAQACLIQLPFTTRNSNNGSGNGNGGSDRGRKNVWVVNTHLGCHYGPEQYEQAKELVIFMQSLLYNSTNNDDEGESTGIILCGDFNSPPFFRSIFREIKNAGFVDTFKVGGIGPSATFPSDGRIPGLPSSIPSWLCFCCKKRPILRLDYIFVKGITACGDGNSYNKDKRSHLRLRYAYVVKGNNAVISSDHLPICSIFEV
mmetsp:Transcript_52576/g.57059  ORF Transcript_52576/g.57059 Transcript_52576/m.57059 type:complete len:352 (+) Transcript_52576:129-1184(+)